MASFVLHVHVFFLLHLLLGFCSGDFEYECTPEKGSTVQIKINKTASGFADYELTEVSQSLCATPTNNDDFFILNGCQAEKDIQIEFTKADKESILTIAGVRMFTLHCQNDNEPVIRTVKATPIGVADGAGTTLPAETFTRKDWIPQLTMTVDHNPPIVIGTTITVKISATDTKDPKYLLQAMECSANSTEHYHPLWKSNDCSSVDTDLFGDTSWNSNKDGAEITHNLEVFRFADSQTLVLGCTVKICPKDKKDECALTCTHKRRRRRRDVNSRTTVVQTTLNVVDSLQDFSNSGSGPFLATSLVSTAVIMYSMVL